MKLSFREACLERKLRKIKLITISIISVLFLGICVISGLLISSAWFTDEVRKESGLKMGDISMNIQDGETETSKELPLTQILLTNQQIFKNNIVLHKSASGQPMFARIYLEFTGAGSAELNDEISENLVSSKDYKWEQIGPYFYLINTNGTPLNIKDTTQYTFLEATALKMPTTAGNDLKVKFSAKAIQSEFMTEPHSTARELSKIMQDGVEDLYKLTINLFGQNQKCWMRNNDKLEIQTPQKAGYDVFVQKGSAGKVNHTSETYTISGINSDTEIIVTYELKNYTITFNSNNLDLGTVLISKNGNNANSPLSVTIEDTITATVKPTVKGNFVNWTLKNGDFSTNPKIEITGVKENNLVYTANFKIKQFTVKFFDFAGGNLLKTQNDIDYGTGATAPNQPTRTGYDWSGWDKIFSSVTSDMDVYGTWTIQTYTINFEIWIEDSTVKRSGEKLLYCDTDWNGNAIALPLFLVKYKNELITDNCIKYIGTEKRVKGDMGYGANVILYSGELSVPVFDYVEVYFAYLIGGGWGMGKEMFSITPKESFEFTEGASSINQNYNIGNLVSFDLTGYTLKNIKSDIKFYFEMWAHESCFNGDTSIWIENNDGMDFKKIKDIKKGDNVYSYNFIKNKIELKEVTYIRKSNEYTLSILKVEDEVINCTRDHKFYTEKRGYISARDLFVGEKILTSCGYKKVINFQEDVYVDWIYNFRVKDNHNYFVGNIKVLAKDAHKIIEEWGN